MRNLIEMPSPQGVAASSKVILNLPVGMTYDELIFQNSASLTPDKMTNFKVRAGTKTIIDVSSFEVIEDLNKHYNRPQATNIYTLWFLRPEFKEDVRALYVFGTANVGSLTVEFDIPSGVVSPTCKVYAVQRAPQPMGLVTKIREFPTSYATSGKQQIDNIPRAANIAAVHLKKADVSQVEFEINSGTGPAKIVEASKTILEVYQKQYGRVPQTAKYTHIDFCLTGDFTAPLPSTGLVDMRIRPTVDASGALTTVVEYLDGENGI